MIELHASKRRKLEYLSIVQSNHLLSGEPLSANSPTHKHAVHSQKTQASTNHGPVLSKQLSAQDLRPKPPSDSSVFQLQIQELLAKVRPPYGSRREKVEAAVRKLKRVIELIPNREPISVISSARIGEIVPAKNASTESASRARSTRIPQYQNSISGAKARSRGKIFFDLC